MGVAQLVARAKLVGENLNLNPAEHILGEDERITLTVTKHLSRV